MKTENIIYAIHIDDVQNESQYRLGRNLKEDELERVQKMLNYGISENMNFIYDALFKELTN